MDSIPRYEFHKIFKRISQIVNLKGAISTEDIDDRINNVIWSSREAARTTWKESEKIRFYKEAKGLEILKENGFAEATIKEIINNPYGFVSLTLRFDTEKAEQMKRAFERARRRRAIV